MGRTAKLIAKLRQNPKNVRFEDLDTLLIRLGFEKRQRGGSHVVYSYLGRSRITVPIRKPFVGPIYVKQALQIIDDMLDDLDDED